MARRGAAGRGARAVAALALALLPAPIGGCAERAAGLDTPAPASPPAAPPAMPGPEVTPAPRALPLPLSRLTRDQLLHSLADLLGLDPAGAPVLPEELAVDGLRGDATSLLHGLDRSEGYAALAAWAAERADVDALLSAHAPCTDAVPACVRPLVAGLGRLLLRRPLAPDDPAIAGYAGLIERAAAEGLDLREGTRLAIEAMLQAPEFLYLLEPAGDAGAALPTWALANRLSLWLVRAAPDPALVAEVDAGGWERPGATPADAAQASALALTEHLLDDPRAARGLRDFVRDWLRLHTLDRQQVPRLPAPAPPLPEDLYARLQAEPLAMFDRLGLREGRPLLDALVEQRTALDPATAALYGLPAPARDELVDLSSEPYRLGLLTQPAILALDADGLHTSLIRRGLTILRTFLCEDVPPPPADAATRFAAQPPGLSDRERFALHATDPACRGCHQVFDPLGYPFEPYDGLGRHRFSDGRGNLLRQDGSIELDGRPHDYASVGGFARALRGSAQVRRCLVTRFLHHALGRRPDRAEDRRALDALDAAYARSEGDWPALVRATLLQVALARPGDATGARP